MTAKQVMALTAHDRLNYRGKTCRVVDWVGHLEPVFALDGTRIDAEPVFEFSNGLRHTIHSAFWGDIHKPV